MIKFEKEQITKKLQMTQSLLKDEQLKRQKLTNENGSLQRENVNYRLTLENSQEKVVQLQDEAEFMKKMYD